MTNPYTPNPKAAVTLTPWRVVFQAAGFILVVMVGIMIVAITAFAAEQAIRAKFRPPPDHTEFAALSREHERRIKQLEDTVAELLESSGGG